MSKLLFVMSYWIGNKVLKVIHICMASNAVQISWTGRYRNLCSRKL